MAESVRQYHQRRLTQLKARRTPWEPVWQELSRFIAPGLVRLDAEVPTGGSATSKNQGKALGPEVIDNTPQKGHRVFRSGMYSGMTSQSRPWMKVSTHDMDLREVESVKQHLDITTTRMRELMSKTNMYDAFHAKYGALGLVGTSASYLTPHDKYIVREHVLTAGQYWIAQNELGLVDTMYHMIPLTADQIMRRFTQSGDRIPQTVKDTYDKTPDQMYIVWHAMEPRRLRDRDSKRPDQMPFLSNYWMDEDEGDNMLRESGTTINRVVASRWDIHGSDEYGYSVGMDALADSKQLQVQQGEKLEILAKTNRPPMSAPTAMKGHRHSLVPGSLTFSDEVHAKGGYRPVLDVSSFNYSALMEDIRNTQDSIRDTFYADLFMMVSNMPGVQPRNEFEIAERKEEKLLQLGPALDRNQSEELQPKIAILYHDMKERGLLPPLPDELEENEGEMAVEYTSTLAQAQRAVSVGSIERLLGFVGGVAPVRPDAMDKVDIDQSIDEYAERIGAPVSIVRSDEAVAEDRRKREEAMQQEKQVGAAAALAPAMNQASQAAGALAQIDDTPGDPTRLLDELGLSGQGAA